MLSKPDIDAGNWEHVQRRGVIFDTYRRARDTGDANVYFIDGERLFGADMRDSCTVDGCHPNDLGFYRMARAVLPTLEQVLYH
jgi:lysophospholipase L1-like esterase